MPDSKETTFEEENTKTLPTHRRFGMSTYIRGKVLRKIAEMKHTVFIFQQRHLSRHTYTHDNTTRCDDTTSYHIISVSKIAECRKPVSLYECHSQPAHMTF